MKITIDKKIIEINKLPLGRYAELLKVIRSLVKNVGDLNFNVPTSELIDRIPELLTNNLPEMIELMRVGSGLPLEEVEQFGLNEAIDVVLAIIEVNQYTQVYEKLKKAFARLPKINLPTPTAGSPVPSTPSPQPTAGVNSGS